MALLQKFRGFPARPIGLAGAFVVFLVLGGLAHWVGAAALAGETRDVKIDNYSFSPGTLTVPLGTTVTWTNRDAEVHTVVADDTPPTFRSAGLDTGDSFSFTFSKAGTFPYHCSVHPHMTGTIIVQ